MLRGMWLAVAALVSLAGCAVIKTTDTTDASFKRHQSVHVLGWPIYSRVTDHERGSSTRLAAKLYGPDEVMELEPAELITEPDSSGPVP